MNPTPALLFIVACALLAGCGQKPESSPGALPATAASNAPSAKKMVVAMLPKLINIDYFDACKRGAAKAADELGITLIYDGPTEPSGSEQNKFFDTWIRQGVQAICIAP